MIQISKTIIRGDGIDYSTVYFRGVQDEQISYVVNGAAHQAAATIPTSIPGEYIAAVEISCDTPTLTIVITQGDETAIIYSVGAP